MILTGRNITIYLWIIRNVPILHNIRKRCVGFNIDEDVFIFICWDICASFFTFLNQTQCIFYGVEWECGPVTAIKISMIYMDNLFSNPRCSCCNNTFSKACLEMPLKSKFKIHTFSLIPVPTTIKSHGDGMSSAIYNWELYYYLRSWEELFTKCKQVNKKWSRRQATSHFLLWNAFSYGSLSRVLLVFSVLLVLRLRLHKTTTCLVRAQAARVVLTHLKN